MSFDKLKSIVPNRGILQIKSYVFGISDIARGEDERVINEFCREHNVVNVTFDHNNNGNLIYRILYRVKV